MCNLILKREVTAKLHAGNQYAWEPENAHKGDGYVFQNQKGANPRDGPTLQK